MKSFRYKSIFSFSSQSFIGHLEEYFATHSDKYVAHIISPRVPNTKNIVRLYKKGKLIEEKKLWSHHNIILYFLVWYIQHLYCLFYYFKSGEKVYAIVFMPHLFFFSSLQRMFRQIHYVFFVGDYCPDPHPLIRLYEWVRKYYHDRILYALYLSDSLNKIMNGMILSNEEKKTVMWGVLPKKNKRTKPKSALSLLFVGLVKNSQGHEFFLKFLRDNPRYSLSVLGICDPVLYRKYQKMIKTYKIERRVFFPNRFFSDSEVENISKSCHVGLALYDTSKMNMTYYTEPGKVKYYAELGLPIVMSNVSSIVSYVKKYKAGEIVQRDVKSVRHALYAISQDYMSYIKGLKKFNNHFLFDSYYKKKFRFLER